MRNGLNKEYKWIVFIMIIVCIACKAKGGKKMEIFVSSAEQIYDSKNNGDENFAVQLSKIVDVLNEQRGGYIKDNQEADFRIIRELYIYMEQRNDIDIYYPQLSGLEDTEKENRINALIKEDVKKIIGEKNKEGDDTLYCINLDYEVKFLNERIISILYEGRRGYIMPGRARMLGKAIATTIDIEEEKIITLKEVVTDFTELSDMLLEDEFENITMWEGKAGTFEVSWEYKGYEDKEYEIEKDLREEERQWYTDGNNFIVILEEFQDYNEYSISNDLVKHILDEEFLKKLE